MLTTTQVAETFNVDQAWVRANAAELGGIRLNRTGHYRFPAAEVELRIHDWTLRKDEPARSRTRPGRPRLGRTPIPASTKDW
jgi:hypothetical protein